MTPQASQTIPEKPGGRVRENENQIAGQRASNGEREVQEFRSSGVAGVQELQNAERRWSI
jgi:hypothetical protein